MISVCIPVYNCHVSSLVTSLKKQISGLDSPVELVLIDDCSTKECLAANEGAFQLADSCILLQENHGRARIRNLFTSEARYDYLLFLDCDSLVISDSFIRKYMDLLKEKAPDVVCGGRIYPKRAPSRGQLLRWKYGVKKESKPAEYRNSYPNRSFMTNNFVIKRKILADIPFDERIRSYGHEDSLMGYQLEKNNIAILHIENPVLNGELETNAVFLDKTDEGIANLVKISEYINHDPLFTQNISVLKACAIAQVTGFSRLISARHFLFGKIIRKAIKMGIVSMFLFDLYKLMLLCHLLKRQRLRG